MLNTKHKTYSAFTLIETVTTLMVSGIIFLGLFYVFTVLNNKFEKEFIKSELTDYCNYALDDIAESIRIAENIRLGSQDISSLDEDSNVINNYYLDPISGIMKNGRPIYLEDLNSKSHNIFFNPIEKNGYIKYELERWEIVQMSQSPEYSQNIVYSEASPLVTQNTIVIKLYTKIIMDLEADYPKENIYFKRVIFSPGMYLSLFS